MSDTPFQTRLRVGFFTNEDIETLFYNEERGIMQVELRDGNSLHVHAAAPAVRMMIKYFGLICVGEEDMVNKRGAVVRFKVYVHSKKEVYREQQIAMSA